LNSRGSIRKIIEGLAAIKSSRNSFASRARVLAVHVGVAERANDRRAEPREPLLHDVIGCASLQALDRDFLAKRAGHEDERHVGRPLDRQRQRRLTVESRKPVVGKNDVESARVEGGGECVARVDGDDFTAQALRAQRRGDQLAIDWIVLEVKHPKGPNGISHARVPPHTPAAVR
jgi:hypothetical protein